MAAEFAEVCRKQVSRCAREILVMSVFRSELENFVRTCSQLERHSDRKPAFDRKCDRRAGESTKGPAVKRATTRTGFSLPSACSEVKTLGSDLSKR